MENLVEKAVMFLVKTDGQGLISQKIQFMKKKGLNDQQITEAINRASNGMVVESAMGGG